ncbi:TON1 Recruiting Motif 31 [Hibiscus trionum]|nr:TON1 Recruiting Motif 31 [Hibiscus trionum]
MCTSTSATAGCLSGILRRILCSTALPTHPSDHTTEEANSVASFNKQEQLDLDGASSKVTPGIVARLMGLDSLPETSLLKSQLHPNSIARSRSMNSVDYKQDDGSIQGKHRRVNSTLSFRDMPAYFELENEEFFVLSFEKRSERKERKSKEGKSKGGSGELKQRKENKENQGEKVPEKKIKEDNEEASKSVLNVLDEEKMNREMAKCREANDLCLEKKVSAPNGTKLRQKKKNIQHPGTQNVEPECSSEDSSPVSVLVFDQFINDHHVPTPDEDSKAAQGSNPRRKLSADLENYECKPPCNDGNFMEDGGRENNIEVKKDWHSERNLEGWEANAICRVIEAEVAKSSWSCSKSNTEELEDITADFGSKILDQLLDELLYLSLVKSEPVKVQW